MEQDLAVFTFFRYFAGKLTKIQNEHDNFDNYG